MFGKSTRRSIPKPKTVHGVNVEKVPTGRYLDALSKLKEAPQEVISACFPGESLTGFLEALAGADMDTVISLLVSLVAGGAPLVIGILCDIIGVDRDTAINTLTPKELADVFVAYWELNDMTAFFELARTLPAKLFARSTTSST